MLADATSTTLALALVMATQSGCFDRVPASSSPKAAATPPRRLDAPPPAEFSPPYGVDAGVWGRASELDRAAFVTLWHSSVFGLECGDGGATTDDWFSVMLLVRSYQEALLRRLAHHAPHPEAKAYGWIGLVKLRIVQPQEARAALVALNQDVDTCGGCIIVFKSDKVESLAAYFDAPLPDEPDRDWRPAGAPPPLDLPGVPRVPSRDTPAPSPGTPETLSPDL